MSVDYFVDHTPLESGNSDSLWISLTVAHSFSGILQVPRHGGFTRYV